jgi:glycosyltransferase involved in cell wall biosynthesis
LRILFFTENFPPETNAAATRVSERARHWIAAGHEVTIVTCAPNFPHGKLFPGWKNRWREVESRDGIRVVRVKTFIAKNEGVVLRTLDFLSFMVAAFAAALFERRPDIVCSTSPQFFAAVGAWALSAVRRLPYVFELGDLWPRSIVAVGAMKDSAGLRAMEKLELFLYRRADAVVALTQSFKDNLVSRGIAAEKIFVILNGVEPELYGPRTRDPQLARETGVGNDFTIGYVGTHGMAHGLSNVLDAAERLRDAPGIKFLFAGPGAERERLIAEARSRALPNVVFLSPQPKERMPEVWSLCDVALVHLKNSPVFAEVIPSKIFEAMGMGLPILLAAPKGEATRIVEGENAGLAVAPEDPAALAEAARRLAADSALRRGLATASLAAAPRHSRAAQAAAMMRAFEGVLAARRAVD